MTNHAEITEDVRRFVAKVYELKSREESGAALGQQKDNAEQYAADFIAAREKAVRLDEARYVQHSFDQKILEAKKNDKSSGAYWFKITIDTRIAELESK